MVQKILPAEIITQNAAFAVVMFLGTGAMRISTTAPTAGRRWMEGIKVNENFEKIKGRLGEAEKMICENRKRLMTPSCEEEQ